MDAARVRAFSECGVVYVPTGWAYGTASDWTLFCVYEPYGIARTNDPWAGRTGGETASLEDFAEVCAGAGGREVGCVAGRGANDLGGR